MTEHLELQQERIEALNAEVSSLNIQDLPTPTTESTPSSTTIINPSRSHDPDTNKKRSDPFEFGNRNLKADDDVYEFNAWDNVKPDDDHHAFAEVQYAKQRESPVSDFDKRTLTIFFNSFLFLHHDDQIKHSSSEASAHERNKLSNVFRSYLIMQPSTSKFYMKTFQARS